MDGTFLRCIDLPNNAVSENCCLKVYQKCVGDVGCVVWDAALVLLKYLFTDSGRKYVCKKHVLELGAGTGAVGLASVIAGAAKVVITDLPEHLPLMKFNISENIDVLCKCLPEIASLKQVQAHVLRWGNKSDFHEIFSNALYENCHSNLQCILIADCIYYQEGMIKLYETIVMILNGAHKNCNVLCCYEVRSTPEKITLLNAFFQLIKSNPILNVLSVPYSEMDEQYRSDDIYISVISKSVL